MSPDQDLTPRQRNELQDNKEGRRRPARQPRSRECLLKGCGRAFRPGHPMARYCSQECRQKARQWSQWKSRQRWRQSENGRKKRQQQSDRHRERLRRVGDASCGRKDGAGGSSQGGVGKFFFAYLRSLRLLREVSTKSALAAAAILLA